MSSQFDYRVELEGDAQKFREVLDTLECACCDGGSISLGELLLDKDFSIEDYPESILEGNCHYLGLLAVLLCKDIISTRISFEQVFRSFMNGVEMSGEKLVLYFYGPSEQSDFFDSLLSTTDYVRDYQTFCDDEETEYDLFEEIEEEQNNWNPDKAEDSDVTGELTGW